VLVERDREPALDRHELVADEARRFGAGAERLDEGGGPEVLVQVVRRHENDSTRSRAA
jgi:hypothetical protein